MKEGINRNHLTPAEAEIISVLREHEDEMAAIGELRLRKNSAINAGAFCHQVPSGASKPPEPVMESDRDGWKCHAPRLQRGWFLTARSEQRPPAGDWRTWLVMGGRGSGKTRAGAEWVHALASAGERSDLRIALVAETLGDAREVMIDGVSGICRIARDKCPDFEISRRRLVWRNGAVAQIFSSEDPEALRGPQFHFAWCDEQISALCAHASTMRGRHFISFKQPLERTLWSLL